MSFKWKMYGKKPTSFFGFFEWLYLLYACTTGLYMLDAWERTVFNTVLIVVLSMFFYAGFAFLPQHVYSMLTHLGFLEPFPSIP